MVCFCYSSLRKWLLGNAGHFDNVWKVWHARPRHLHKVWSILNFWVLHLQFGTPLNNYHLFFYSHCLHSSVCITFLCVCVCRCLCVCVCATVAAHQIRTLLAWKCQVRAGAYQAPATKEYGNKAGDKWIISCITHFSLAMYLATPTSGPAVSLMISRMWQPETPAPSLDCYQRPLSPQQMCLLCS